MDIRFVVWDFRTPPTAERLAEAIRSFGGGPIYGTAVDSGTDNYILALSGEPITAEQALAEWNEEMS